MKFDYGQEAIYKQKGGDFDSAKHGSIVSMTIIETIDQVSVFGHPIGTVMYLMEFGDGTERLVPEEALEPA